MSADEWAPTNERRHMYGQQMSADKWAPTNEAPTNKTL